MPRSCSGQARPEGIGAIVYHGMVQGLDPVLLKRAPPIPPDAAQLESPTRCRRDRELVRLLANMVLRTQSEVMHVY